MTISAMKLTLLGLPCRYRQQASPKHW